ncbi:MAG: hypothetical protein QOJ71_972 [Actinomycetota bacterium]|nr:hypothetical protein [Actinomycetota bacterium]
MSGLGKHPRSRGLTRESAAHDGGVTSGGDPDQGTVDPRADRQVELRRIEAAIATLRPQIQEIRERLANHWDDPTDGPERSEILTMAEEQEAILAVLESRREELGNRTEQP